MASNKPNIFNTVLAKRPVSSTFDLCKKHRTTYNIGQLIPTYCTEVLPGDSFSIRQENMVRFAPLVAPIYHDVKVKTYWFFIPCRILWDNWEDFISPDNVTERNIVWPHMVMTALDTIDNDSLINYLDIPTANLDMEQDLSVLPLAAYFKIYDEWFRNQHIQTVDQFETITDGDNTGNYKPKAVAPPLNPN